MNYYSILPIVFDIRPIIRRKCHSRFPKVVT